MKIAALYDIHGNLPALNALLEELKKVQPDLIVVGGDIVSGPLPGQTLERLSLLSDQVRCIRGNRDREVVMAFNGQPFSPAMPEEMREVARWVAGKLTRSQRCRSSFYFKLRAWERFCFAMPPRVVTRNFLRLSRPRNSSASFSPV